jgi:GntR family transcriptional regulator
MAVQAPAPGTSLSRRIADALTDAIARGDYDVGARLPPEITLGRMFGASRFTIREALVELRARGLVASRRGSGSVVVRRAPQPPAFGESYRSVDEFLASVVEVPLQALEIRDVIADDVLATALRCEPGRQFLLLRGVRRSRTRPDELPLALTEAYINPSYAAIRPHLAVLTESIAGTAERVLGVRVQSIIQELEPVVLDTEHAAYLSAPAGILATLVRRWYVLDGAVTLLASRSVYPQGRGLFRTELRRERFGQGLAPSR